MHLLEHVCVCVFVCRCVCKRYADFPVMHYSIGGSAIRQPHIHSLQKDIVFPTAGKLN